MRRNQGNASQTRTVSNADKTSTLRRSNTVVSCTLYRELSVVRNTMQQCIICIGAEVSKPSFSSFRSNLFTSYKTQLPTCEDKENVEFSITYKSESIISFASFEQIYLLTIAVSVFSYLALCP